MGKSGKADLTMPDIVGAMPGSDLDLSLLKSLEDPPAHGGGGGGRPPAQMLRPNIPPAAQASQQQASPSSGGYPQGGPSYDDDTTTGGPPMPHLQSGNPMSPGGVVPPASKGIPTREQHSMATPVHRDDPMELLAAAQREQEAALLRQQQQQQALAQQQQAPAQAPVEFVGDSFFVRYQKHALYAGLLILLVVGYYKYKQRWSSGQPAVRPMVYY